MERFVPREKMSKRARREMDAQRRTTWDVQPVTRRIESKKAYDRNRARRMQRDELSGADFFIFGDFTRRSARASA